MSRESKEVRQLPINFDQSETSFPAWMSPGIRKNVEAYMTQHGIKDPNEAFELMRTEDLTMSPYHDHTGIG